MLKVLSIVFSIDSYIYHYVLKKKFDYVYLTIIYTLNNNNMSKYY